MSTLFQFLAKLSCILTVGYLFYRLVLRPLTFYTWNRWYLLLYSMLAFAIPFIDVSGLLAQHRLHSTSLVQVIPTLASYTGFQTTSVQKAGTTPFTLWDGCLYLFVSGAVVLFVRLAI